MALIIYSRGSDNGGGGGWQPLPEGTYDLRINSVEQKTSSKGNPQIQLVCEVMDGPYAGKRATVWYSLVPSSTWKVERLITALGIIRQPTGEFDAAGTENLAFDPDHLIGRVVRYNVKQREYQGKVNNDFADESRSPLDEQPEPVVRATTTLKAVQPAPAAAPAEQLNLPETARRRPRPAGPA
jgi:hypothetical protein